MTLEELFAALQNPNMVVEVQKNNVQLTKIYVSGYEQLQASLLAQTVSQITVQNVNQALVELAGSASA